MKGIKGVRVLLPRVLFLLENCSTVVIGTYLDVSLKSASRYRKCYETGGLFLTGIIRLDSVISIHTHLA